MVQKAKTIKESKTTHYFEAKGTRKTSIARVRLAEDKKGVLVNGRDYKAYFPLVRLQEVIVAPMKLVSEDKLSVSAKVRGGGLSAQADAIRLGIARALLVAHPEFRNRLRQAGFLTRDSRMVERKKYGLKKARRAPQWAKR